MRFSLSHFLGADGAGVITAKHDAEEGAAGEMRLTEPEQRPRLIVPVRVMPLRPVAQRVLGLAGAAFACAADNPAGDSGRGLRLPLAPDAVEPPHPFQPEAPVAQRFRLMVDGSRTKVS